MDPCIVQLSYSFFQLGNSQYQWRNSCLSFFLLKTNRHGNHHHVVLSPARQNLCPICSSQLFVIPVCSVIAVLTLKHRKKPGHIRPANTIPTSKKPKNIIASLYVSTAVYCQYLIKQLIYSLYLSSPIPSSTAVQFEIMPSLQAFLELFDFFSIFRHRRQG